LSIIVSYRKVTLLAVSFSLPARDSLCAGCLIYRVNKDLAVLILVWSTVAVAIVRMSLHSGLRIQMDHTFWEIIGGDLFVFNIFIISAAINSIMAIKRIDEG
jgi:hypothetical protein